jgi:hypothetical protein
LFSRLFVNLKLNPLNYFGDLSQYYSARHRCGRPYERFGLGIIFAWIFLDRLPIFIK